jgi:hypothetical protein
MASWRVANSLLALRNQVNAIAPGRDTSSDGTIGDASHSARKSDHNPNADNVVTAMDITHDPVHGVDAGALAEMLRRSEDPRIKYVISNRRFFSSKIEPWTWRPYNGANAHTKHVHVSVSADRALYDDTRPWAIDRASTIHELAHGPVARRFGGIIATVFGGHADPNTSAYDDHLIDDEELGVALPNRFRGARPKVRVINPATGKTVTCSIVDVGPWNTTDPYWETGARPQAETGTDLKGRPTNRAGIDLTPAAARAVGIDGKGTVEWEFVGAGQIEPPPDMSGIDAILARIRERIQQWGTTMTMPTAGQPIDLGTAQQEIARLREIIETLSQISGAAGQAGTTPGPILSPVDKALGGEAMVGLKTPLSILGFAAMWIMQAFGAVGTATGDKATTTGQVLTALLAAFGGLGVTGKFDRAIKAITIVATVLPKIAALAAAGRPKPGA